MDKNIPSFQDLASLAFEIGDLIVHKDHGIGVYEGLKILCIEAIPHECVELRYQDAGRLFVPVEHMDLLSLYGGVEGEKTLDKLGSTRWHVRQKKLKEHIYEIATSLLTRAAERFLKKAPLLSAPKEALEAFCANFKFTETPDQRRAIEETLGDMVSGHPMDRLICGDTGFGKTEVALRAAFVAVSSGKQVALIVPTTLLCHQHFKTFQKRFEETPFRIAHLSRLVSHKEAQTILKDLKNGEIHLLIATHALFSPSISFFDLGLLIIDEERHFGVVQKEKMKEVFSAVHVLTLSATPIPRTLHLSLHGLKSLSLLKTPPNHRLAVQTFVIPFEEPRLKEALYKEYERGGQIFFVTPRIERLPYLYDFLTKHVPEISVATAHGKMPANELEKVITAFYDHKFSLLLSTHIIESGIDIGTANTLIVDRSDLFGLAQLYQLRGRVGRSLTQGYAYFTLPKELSPTKNATERLRILSKLTDLGGGMKLARYDLQMRGGGNIMGHEQSGHIQEIGIEFYHHLLQQAILELKEKTNGNESVKIFEFTPKINLGIAVQIPVSYVSDLSVRVILYRQIASFTKKSQMDALLITLIQKFGPIPQEVRNLFDTVELKILCRKANIEKIEGGAKGVVFSFYQNECFFPENLTRLLYSEVLKKRGTIKLRPDHKIIFSYSWQEKAVKIKIIKYILGILSEKVNY